jgi:hypothetical protein
VGVSQTCLWFTFCKAVISSALSQLNLAEKLSFKVTDKKVRCAWRSAG